MGGSCRTGDVVPGTDEPAGVLFRTSAPAPTPLRPAPAKKELAHVCPGLLFRPPFERLGESSDAGRAFGDMTNVVRFPVERHLRPTLGRLRWLKPDGRFVLEMASAFGMDPPSPGLRERVDAATAAQIARVVPADSAGREALLITLIKPTLAKAIAACSIASDAWIAAQMAVRRAERAEGSWERAEALMRRAPTLSGRAMSTRRRPRVRPGRWILPIVARCGSLEGDRAATGHLNSRTMSPLLELERAAACPPSGDLEGDLTRQVPWVSLGIGCELEYSQAQPTGPSGGDGGARPSYSAAIARSP